MGPGSPWQPPQLRCGEETVLGVGRLASGVVSAAVRARGSSCSTRSRNCWRRTPALGGGLLGCGWGLASWSRASDTGHVEG